MKKAFTVCALAVILTFAYNSELLAGWLIYHKPEFRGKIIDADTKAPIAGAVVVAIYNSYPIISGPGGGSAKIIKIKEALTDESGVFHIGSYTTLIQPNSVEDTVTFIIFKPGYSSYPNFSTYPFMYIDIYSLFTSELGTKRKIIKNSEEILITNGVVELKRLKTWDERREAQRFLIANQPVKHWPILHKMVEEEHEWIKNNRGWKLEQP